jgi:hypothetical protein
MWSAPTSAARWRSASGVNTIESTYSWRTYSVGFLLSCRVMRWGNVVPIASERAAYEGR